MTDLPEKYSDKDPFDTDTFSMGFGDPDPKKSWLQAGDAIVNAVVLVEVIEGGTQPVGQELRPVGAAWITTDEDNGIEASRVHQSLTGGVAGFVYKITYEIITSLGRSVQRSGLLRVLNL